LSKTTGMRKTFWEYHEAYTHRSVAWKDEVLFTWQWWVGVTLTIICWIIWIVFRKRESTDRLLYSGIFVALVSVTLDNIGVQLSAWNYLKPFSPIIPAYIPFDFALMPVAVMFLIQYFYNRNPWIIGLLFGGLAAFVGEPIFKLLKIYNPTNWKFIYSFPFYTLIYLLAHKLAARDKFNKPK
jgi:hypothetical protein